MGQPTQAHDLPNFAARKSEAAQPRETCQSCGGVNTRHRQVNSLLAPELRKADHHTSTRERRAWRTPRSERVHRGPCGCLTHAFPSTFTAFCAVRLRFLWMLQTSDSGILTPARRSCPIETASILMAPWSKETKGVKLPPQPEYSSVASTVPEVPQPIVILSDSLIGGK
jgi:hypothetical protein